MPNKPENMRPDSGMQVDAAASSKELASACQPYELASEMGDAERRPAPPEVTKQGGRVQVSGIDIRWRPENGTCTFADRPVAMMWIDTTLTGLMAGVQGMVGTERFCLALQSEGRKSVDADWEVISRAASFHEGFRAIATIAAVAGWGEWQLLSLDERSRVCRFRVRSSWEGRYQQSLGVCWGSAMLAGKLAGYCSRLFETNCWADQVEWIAKGDECDEFIVHPSDRSIEDEIESLLASDEATRADMAVALQKLRAEIAQRERAETERATLEEQLRHAQKMDAVGQLAGGVAHDFNNILTAILGNVELLAKALQSKFGPDEPATLSLQQIEHSAMRAAKLTRQLLAFSRKQVARPVILDLNQTLADMDQMLRHLLTEDIEWSIAPAPNLKRIRADAGQLEQVIMNLVVNARDAMPQGGKLTLQTRNVMLDEAYVASHPGAQVGPHVVLTATDTGCGMNAETLEHIFEPFFTTKAVGHGTGLGLAMVYGIVKQSGGHINVTSQVGRGTRLDLYLPAVDASAPKLQLANPAKQQDTGSETILLCEDERSIRNLAVQILQNAGYTVLAAGNGVEGLRLATGYRRELDLLVTDVVMPDMNGRALAESCQVGRPELKVLYISGYASDVIGRHGVLDDGVEFLQKPFTAQSLLRRVRQVLDRASGVASA